MYYSPCAIAVPSTLLTHLIITKPYQVGMTYYDPPFTDKETQEAHAPNRTAST